MRRRSSCEEMGQSLSCVARCARAAARHEIPTFSRMCRTRASRRRVRRRVAAARNSPPFRRAAPNVIRLAYGYELVGPAEARREIGRTGVRSPVDLVVVSGGKPHGDVASVRVNTVERAANRRGYNLVAVDPAGRILGAETFDTCLDSAAAGRLPRLV